MSARRPAPKEKTRIEEAYAAEFESSCLHVKAELTGLRLAKEHEIGQPWITFTTKKGILHIESNATVNPGDVIARNTKPNQEITPSFEQTLDYAFKKSLISEAEKASIRKDDPRLIAWAFSMGSSASHNEWRITPEGIRANYGAPAYDSLSGDFTFHQKIVGVKILQITSEVLGRIRSGEFSNIEIAQEERLRDDGAVAVRILNAFGQGQHQVVHGAGGSHPGDFLLRSASDFYGIAEKDFRATYVLKVERAAKEKRPEGSSQPTSSTKRLSRPDHRAPSGPLLAQPTVNFALLAPFGSTPFAQQSFSGAAAAPTLFNNPPLPPLNIPPIRAQVADPVPSSMDSGSMGMSRLFFEPEPSVDFRPSSNSNTDPHHG